MTEHHTPLDELTPSERAKVNAHLLAAATDCTGVEVPGRPVEAHLACRELDRQAEAPDLVAGVEWLLGLPPVARAEQVSSARWREA